MTVTFTRYDTPSWSLGAEFEPCTLFPVLQNVSTNIDGTTVDPGLPDKGEKEEDSKGK
jgi:hypothetical protein